MPFVEVFTREELPEAVRAQLAESLIVTMLNVEIGYPTDQARALRGTGLSGATFGLSVNRLNRRVAMYQRKGNAR
jgi:hypothetical protein